MFGASTKPVAKCRPFIARSPAADSSSGGGWSPTAKQVAQGSIRSLAPSQERAPPASETSPVRRLASLFGLRASCAVHRSWHAPAPYRRRAAPVTRRSPSLSRLTRPGSSLDSGRTKRTPDRCPMHTKMLTNRGE